MTDYIYSQVFNTSISASSLESSVPSVGQTLPILTFATDPITKARVSDATSVTINFYAPPKNPEFVVTDRTVDEGPFTAVYNSALQGYLAYIPTTSWVSGNWVYQVSYVRPSETTWKYFYITLEP